VSLLRPRSCLLRLLGLTALLVILGLAPRARSEPGAASTAGADAGAPPPIPAESWAGQLDSLSRWLDQRRPGPRCAERCYTLDRLRITGRVGDGPLHFELTGGVIADERVSIPLFGPPSHLRVEDVTEDGKDAVVGFEGDHYFLHTASRHFVLKGTLSLEGDLALTIPGPLNTLLADVTAGAVVEGAKLTGLRGATIHFSREGAAQGSGPTVFQLSRAIRVGREVGFEYRLVMRSGTDLGVVRLPLAFGEKVLDVTGSTGWRVEGGELVLPTSGRTAEMTLTGTLAGVGKFSPDARSGYEWWLLESDPEHRITVAGDARQLDSAESPIPRTQATSRLFLVQRGQHIEATVQPLVSVDVLAAVVRTHLRTIVLTQRGDLVSDDTLSYENNGIDYLLYAPDGRPIYLATDGKAERIMHKGNDARDVLVPLRTGSHSVRVQALADASVRPFGGRLDLPVPSYPLTASSMQITVGLPARVFPVALLGGDKAEWFLDGGDVTAILIGLAVGWAAVRVGPDAPRRRARRLRMLGGAVLAGLWFVSGGAFVAAVVALSAMALFWVASRLLRGSRLAVAVLVLLGFVGFVALVSALSMSSRSGYAPATRMAGYGSDVAPASSTAREHDATGNWVAQTAEGGVLQGVTPVALTLPRFTRSVDASRELVTRDRPFLPVLYYVTDLALLPLELLWLAGAIALLLAHRGPFGDAYGWARTRLLREPPPQAAPAPRAAAPPRTAAGPEPPDPDE
jgi:hypothetical protein